MFCVDFNTAHGLRNSVSTAKNAVWEIERKMKGILDKYDKACEDYDLAVANSDQHNESENLFQLMMDEQQKAISLGNQSEDLFQSIMDLATVLTEQKEKRKEAEQLFKDHEALCTLEFEKIKQRQRQHAPVLEELRNNIAESDCLMPSDTTNECPQCTPDPVTSAAKADTIIAPTNVVVIVATR